MKLKFLIIFIFSATFAKAETYGYTDMRNGSPFDDCKSYMPNIRYKQFGEKRNINIKSAASYDHYNQKGNKQHYSIIKQQKQYSASYQPGSSNGNQTHYKTQNKAHNSTIATTPVSMSGTQLKFNRIKKKRLLSETVAANDIIIEIDKVQRIDINEEDSSTNTPEDPMPISDGIIPMLIFIGIYLLKLRVKS